MYFASLPSEKQYKHKCSFSRFIILGFGSVQFYREDATPFANMHTVAAGW